MVAADSSLAPVDSIVTVIQHPVRGVYRATNTPTEGLLRGLERRCSSNEQIAVGWFGLLLRTAQPNSPTANPPHLPTAYRVRLTLTQ
jgi:hypothetical protein